MKPILTSIPTLLVAFVGTPAAYMQSTANLIAVYPTIKFSCTASIATVAAGAPYVNTCTITQGSGPFRFSVAKLPNGLAMNTTTTSATITGSLGVGHYEYTLNVSGAGYS